MRYGENVTRTKATSSVYCYFLLNYAFERKNRDSKRVAEKLLFSFELCVVCFEYRFTGMGARTEHIFHCYFLLNYARVRVRRKIRLRLSNPRLLFSFELCLRKLVESFCMFNRKEIAIFF